MLEITFADKVKIASLKHHNWRKAFYNSTFIFILLCNYFQISEYCPEWSSVLQVTKYYPAHLYLALYLRCTGMILGVGSKEQRHSSSQSTSPATKLFLYKRVVLANSGADASQA